MSVCSIIEVYTESGGNENGSKEDSLTSNYTNTPDQCQQQSGNGFRTTPSVSEMRILAQTER